jgi:hypothetical protein
MTVSRYHDRIFLLSASGAVRPSVWKIETIGAHRITHPGLLSAGQSDAERGETTELIEAWQKRIQARS